MDPAHPCSSGQAGTAQPQLRPVPELPRLAFSTQETAQVLGLSLTTIRRLIRKGRLRTVRGIRHRMIPRSEIDRLLTV
jgi:excisionase family DNA binding protein